MIRILLAVVAAAIAAGLAAATSMAGTTTLVRGVVLRDPITPVCVDRTPCTAPLASATLVFSRHGTEVARTSTNRRGRFVVRLAPGRYAIRLSRTSLLARLSPRVVRIPRAGPVWLRVDVDTGLRLPGPRTVD
jgi:hypothetical protein